MLGSLYLKLTVGIAGVLVFMVVFVAVWFS